ncbi:MAG TPA: hypothetical protein VLV83_12810 [Acidobacteriota bacterium]|nr:hypothetical protein [Acidobacteriota bacterium]
MAVVLGPWLFAGGPFIISDSGDPVLWENPSQEYFLEGGNAAPSQAVFEIFQNANQSWNEIEDSEATLRNPRALTRGIDADAFLEAITTGRRQNLMVIDEGGLILDEFFGEGASGGILGVTVTITQLTQGGRIIRASHILFNGDVVSDPLFETVVRHELGHFLGLDHTQVGLFEALNGDVSDNADVPVMFPFSIPAASAQLKADDISWLIRLYPAETVIAGSITGRVFNFLEEPVSAVNVVAIPAETTEPLARVAVSSVSDYRDQDDGFFALPGLAPGQYHVFIESLDPVFQGASGIGPFNPPFPIIIPEFYNGEDESSTSEDNPIDRVPVEVSQGIPTFGIDFFLQNRPPLVDAGEDATVVANAQVNLRPTVEDPDGNTLQFEWTQLAGPEVTIQRADERNANFVSPEVEATRLLLFQLRVSDGSLETVDTVRVAVTPRSGPNTPPIVNAGDDQVGRRGEEVLLDGLAQDEDGDELILNWTQISGPVVELSDASSLNPTFTVPSDLEPVELIFRLQADDSRGGVVEDDVSVQVVGNGPPAVSAAAGEAEVKPLTEVTLTANAVDPDGDMLQFSWQQTQGPGVELLNAETAQASFVSPDVDFPTEFAFQVTVDDGEAMAQDSVMVTVIPFRRTIFLGSLSANVPLAQKSGPQTVIVPPSLEDTFVGAAVLNAGDTPTLLRFDALTEDAAIISSSDSDEALAPQAQLARLTGELTPNGSGAATIRARGLQADVQGFFLFGDFGLTRQDGIGASPASSEMFFDLVRLTDSEATLIHLHNPGPEAAEVTLQLFAPDGEMSFERELDLPSQGSNFSRLDALFAAGIEVEDGYLRLVSDQPLQGSAFLVSEVSFSALRGQAMEAGQTLRSPQFFSDPQGGGSTELRLLSRQQETVEGTLRAFDDQGQELASSLLQIEAGQLLIVDAAEVLGLQGDQLIVGHLSVEFPEPVLVQGAVSFTSNQNTTRSTLPLLRDPVLETVFLQVAQSTELGIFTGLALLSASDQTANLTVRVFDAQGQQSAQAEIQLEPGQRVVDLLGSETFFGADFSQNGGHFRVSSDQPIFAFALFGDFAGNFLASIEGQQP